MASRLKLHEELCGILGSRNAYFQPPESTKMSYEAIRYSLSAINQRHANNLIYKSMNCYELILISKNPESVTHDKLLSHFQMIRFVRSYTADNLNHKVYELYY